MFEKRHTKTLWVIIVVSGMCFLLSPILATPIGDVANSLLLGKFEASWVASQDLNPWQYMALSENIFLSATPWQYMALSENIFLSATVLIALTALMFGSYAAWALYRRSL